MVYLFTTENVEGELSGAQTRRGWNPGNFQRTLTSQAWLWRAYRGECGKAQVSSCHFRSHFLHSSRQAWLKGQTDHSAEARLGFKVLSPLSDLEASASVVSFHCLRNSLGVQAGTLSSHRGGKGHMAGQVPASDESVFLSSLSTGRATDTRRLNTDDTGIRCRWDALL